MFSFKLLELSDTEEAKCRHARLSHYNWLCYVYIKKVCLVIADMHFISFVKQLLQFVFPRILVTNH